MEWPNDQLEALHACHIVETSFDSHVLDASFVKNDVKLFNMAEDVSRRLVDLYQAIGAAKPNTSEETSE